MIKDPFNARILQKIQHTEDLISLLVVPDGWELSEFEAGQLAVLGLPEHSESTGSAADKNPPGSRPRMMRRNYSVASSPLVSDYLEFYIALAHPGVFSRRLFALNPGDPIWLAPRFSGLFTMATVPEEAHVILLATSTGLAPFMSFLRTHLNFQNDRRFLLIHGVRHSAQLGYRSELYNLQRSFDNFDYVPIISRPAQEPVPWTGLTGHLQEHWQAGIVEKIWGWPPAPENTHIFLCGNPGMIEDMKTYLGAEGYQLQTPEQPGQIHIESYW